MTSEAESGTTQLNSVQIITFPNEVDVTNAARISEQLQRAVRRGAQRLAERAGANITIVADMTLTDFLDSAAIRGLMSAWREAQRSGIDFRVAVSSAQTMHILQVTGVDKVLKLYPGTAAALAGQMPSPDGRQRAPHRPDDSTTRPGTSM
jgi:anti-anti-sigma factor